MKSGMLHLNDVAWGWLLLWSAIGATVGMVLAYFVPVGWAKRPNYRFTPEVVGLPIFFGMASIFIQHSPLAAVSIGLILSYLLAWQPPEPQRPRPTTEPSKPQAPEAEPIARVSFCQDWAARPRYETEENEQTTAEGTFVGREELLDRLASDFISKRSGTILISGVRGVGKTALVEKALLVARNRLQNRYWQQAVTMLEAARLWISHPIDSQIRGVLRGNGYLAVKQTAENLANRPIRHYWPWRQEGDRNTRGSVRQTRQWLHPVDSRIRRMHQASRSQLFVLKFNASDISGALAEPEKKPDGAQTTSGKPQVNPEKLLRALIRKLFMTCHFSRPNTEAQILQWSLRPKRQRQHFFEILETAYYKSVSKSYKEIISTSINEAVKQAQSSALEGKFNLERIVGLVVCLAIGAAPFVFHVPDQWHALRWYLAGGGAAILATYFTVAWSLKRSRESTSDRARQAQFSYEFDYSLAQMEYDLQVIMRALHPASSNVFDPYRCFDRLVIIFDELDKLENPVQQLNDVITHFKNFFTLSEALFVFITDHEFYEHLNQETAKALRKRQYSAEHTFFTQRIYLRKPDFPHFRQTVYGFCNSKALINRVQSKDAPADPDLVDFVIAQNSDLLPKIEQWSALAALTHLYVFRQKYPDNRNQIESAFRAQKGWSAPLAVAQIWCELATIDGDQSEVNAVRESYESAGGWTDPEAVAFLYHRRSRFGEADRNKIESGYEKLGKPSLKRYTSLEQSPFTLSDLARALCFQTRNHYFDLYHLIYDYVGSYTDGIPVLHMEDERFTRQQKLMSRYQQMIEAAFLYRREDHPSREYFNTLLMESLYSAFDGVAGNGPAMVKSIFVSVEKLTALMSAQVSAAVPASPTAVGSPAAATAGPPATEPLAYVVPVPLMTLREIQHINEAILRLLRLLNARKAIRPDPSLVALLQQETPMLAFDSNGELTTYLKEAQFEWGEDCEPVITQEGIGLEPYEKDLIQMWDTYMTQLDPLRVQLYQLSVAATLPGDHSVSRLWAQIDKLRETADGLRSRSTTVSRLDAAALKAAVGAPETLVTRVAALLLEVIRGNEENKVLLPADAKQPSGEQSASLRSILADRVHEIDSISKLPVRGVIYPEESKSLVYLLAGPIPADVDAKSLEQLTSTQDVSLLWYAPGSDLSQLPKPPAALRYYLVPPGTPSVLSLYIDFTGLVKQARLKQMAATWQGQKRKDKALLLRAGAELLGPLNSNSAFVTGLSHPSVSYAVSKIDALTKRFRAERAQQVYASYGFGGPISWSADQFMKTLIPNISLDTTHGQPSTPGGPLFNVQKCAEDAVLQGVGGDLSKLSPESFASNFTSTGTEGFTRFFLQNALNEIIRGGWQEINISGESDFKDQVLKEFGPLPLSWIEDLAKGQKLPLSTVLSNLPTLFPELEKQRLSLKSKGVTGATAAS